MIGSYWWYTFQYADRHPRLSLPAAHLNCQQHCHPVDTVNSACLHYTHTYTHSMSPGAGTKQHRVSYLIIDGLISLDPMVTRQSTGNDLQAASIH